MYTPFCSGFELDDNNNKNNAEDEMWGKRDLQFDNVIQDAVSWKNNPYYYCIIIADIKQKGQAALVDTQTASSKDEEC